MTKTPTLPNAIHRAALLIEQAYGDQAPDRALGIEAAQISAWALAEFIEQAFDFDRAGPAIAQRLAHRADAQPPIDCGGGERAYGCWVGRDLLDVAEVIGG